MADHLGQVNPDGVSADSVKESPITYPYIRSDDSLGHGDKILPCLNDSLGHYYACGERRSGRWFYGSRPRHLLPVVSRAGAIPLEDR